MLLLITTLFRLKRYSQAALINNAPQHKIDMAQSLLLPSGRGIQANNTRKAIKIQRSCIDERSLCSEVDVLIIVREYKCRYF